MFQFTQKILFRHCDPAGIVFYPRYFEMLNDVVEAFFETELHQSFSEVIKNNGVPTAQISASFSAPSRLGDILSLELVAKKLGRTSLNLSFEAHCNDELRFSATSVLVYVDKTGKSTAWPDSLRDAIQIHIDRDNK